MQWGNKCDAEAVSELRQYKDYQKPDPNETYHLAFNCETHVPEKNAQQYIIKEIK
jgi:hypothetical protein